MSLGLLCMLLLPAFPPGPKLGKFDLLLANSIVDVFSLDLPAHSHVGLHQNIYDVVIIALQQSDVTLVPAEGEARGWQLNAGDVRVLRSFTAKSLANDAAADGRFVVVELKSHGVSSGQCGCSGEVEKIICGCSPEHLPPIWALSVGGATLAGAALEPGQAFEGASYRDQSLIVALSALDLDDQQGAGPAVVLPPGAVKWLPEGKRQFKNMGAAPARFITIEF